MNIPTTIIMEEYQPQSLPRKTAAINGVMGASTITGLLLPSVRAATINSELTQAHINKTPENRSTHCRLIQM